MQFTSPMSLCLSLTLRPTVSRQFCHGTKHHSGAYDQVFIIVWQSRVCWFGAPSLTRGGVCRLQLQLALASAVIFGSESRRTRVHILLSHIWDFFFRRLLRLVGSRWRYSTPPPHGSLCLCHFLFTSLWGRPQRRNIPLRFQTKILCISSTPHVYALRVPSISSALIRSVYCNRFSMLEEQNCWSTTRNCFLPRVTPSSLY
jgi:hypothetical protein